MSDNMSQDMIMDLDLNQEPLDSSTGSVRGLGLGLGLGFSLNDFQASHGRIEDRIRQLEAVTARARQRQRWREARNSNETNYISLLPTVHEIGDSNEQGSPSVRQNASERGNGKNCKRDSSYLVAKALEMNLDDKKQTSSDSSGNFYDCNICLDIAKEPILTCCGHLFCWACFYKLPYVDSTSKECPVCKGEVTDKNVTPIYGNGNDTHHVSESDSDSKLPPRPRARRVESVRQQRISRGGSNVPFVEAIRQIRSRSGGLGGFPRHQGLDADGGPQVFSDPEGGGAPPVLSRQVSSVSVQAALVNAGTLVHGLLQSTDTEVVEGSFQDASVVEPEIQIMDSTAEINASVVTSDMAVETETDAIEIHPFAPARRRTRVYRVSDVDSGVSREPRRRRLRR